jgi:hypothetical protein
VCGSGKSGWSEAERREREERGGSRQVEEESTGDGMPVVWVAEKGKCKFKYDGAAN